MNFRSLSRLCLLLAMPSALAQAEIPAVQVEISDSQAEIPAAQVRNQEAPASEAPKPFLLGGIQTHELDHQRWAAALHKSGMNTVQVTVYAHQGPWNTAKLWYAEEEPSVLHEIRAARRSGLQVVLVLRVALDHNEPANRHLWHGLVYPESEQATQEWFRIYGDFVLKWGRIAEREGIEVLGVASEMNSLAATFPVDELPGLAEYYLDDSSQERLRALVGRSEHLFDEDVRVSMGAGDFESLDDFLVQRNAAERNWARAYSFADHTSSAVVGDRGRSERAVSSATDSRADLPDDAEERLASINKRRQLLDASWRDLIKKVRTVYTGRLTLAANFDNYHEVSFWDALDFIGINAYFQLREALETPLTEAGLAAGWSEIFADIETFREAHELTQEVIFTELGYTRWRGVTVAPWSSKGFIPIWDETGDISKDRAFFWEAQPFEPEERALALRALYRVWAQGDTSLAGVLYWKLSSRLELQRFEPFMLYLGDSAQDPLFPALTSFAAGIRPLSSRLIENAYQRGIDAIVRDDSDTLKRLLAERSDYMSLDSGHTPDPGHTPWLHLAVRLGRSELVSLLIEDGFSVDQRDETGALAIHWTCYQEDPELVALLRPSAGQSWLDESHETPLMKCGRLDNVLVASRLLAENPEQIGLRNRSGQSALHLAADQGSATLVDQLLAAGGDVSGQNEHGFTPLHLAARRGEVEIVRALAKSSKGIANPEGNRPLAEAAIHGSSEVFHLLFEPKTAGEINIYGQSLLHLAAHGGDLEILKTLLQHFSAADPVDDDGWTPLAFATRNGRVEAARLLLSRGASIEHANHEGTPVLHLAAGSYEPRLIQMFARREINLDVTNSAGNTALHVAAGWGRVENIGLLLEAGASTGLRNLEGDTPSEVAEKFEKHRAALLFRQFSSRVAATVSSEP